MWWWWLACRSDPAVVGAAEPAPDDLAALVVADATFEVTLVRGDEVLHRWQVDPAAHGVPTERTSFRRAWLQPDGGLLALVEYESLWRLAPDGAVGWVVADGNHHDVAPTDDGGWFSLVEVPVPGASPENHLLRYGPDGRPVARVDLVEALAASPGQEALAAAARVGEDPLHLNGLWLLEGHDDPRFADGHLLVSSRAQDTLFVVDPVAQVVTWSGAGPFLGQHDPRFLAPDRLLLFDNGDRARGSSAVELSFPGLEERWRSEALPFATCCGTVQRLGEDTWVVHTPRGLAVRFGDDGHMVDAWDPPETPDRLYQAEWVEVPEGLLSEDPG